MSAVMVRSVAVTCVLLVFLQILSGCGGGSSSVTPATGKIVFMSSRDSDTYEIYIMNDNGTGLKRLTNNNGQESCPSISPDGSRIVYCYTPDPLLVEPDVYIMNVDGSGTRRLTYNSLREAFPTFSPDGETVAFERSLTGGRTICFVDADGGPEIISGPTAEQPHFSPDGSKVVFSRPHWESGYMSIYIADYTPGQRLPDGTMLTASADRDDRYPKFSPDGTKIAFERREANHSREIYIMNADGTGQTKLTNSAGHSYGPLSFSPDGSKIAFVSDRDGNEELYVMNVDGTNQTRLTRNTAYDTAPSYGVIDGNGEINVIIN